MGLDWRAIVRFRKLAADLPHIPFAIVTAEAAAVIRTYNLSACPAYMRFCGDQVEELEFEDIEYVMPFIGLTSDDVLDIRRGRYLVLVGKPAEGLNRSLPVGDNGGIWISSESALALSIGAIEGTGFRFFAESREIEFVDCEWATVPGTKRKMPFRLRFFSGVARIHFDVVSLLAAAVNWLFQAVLFIARVFEWILIEITFSYR
jgi:hypothetical protein